MYPTRRYVDGWEHLPLYTLQYGNGTVCLIGTRHTGLPHTFVRIARYLTDLRAVGYRAVFEDDTRRAWSILPTVIPEISYDQLVARFGNGYATYVRILLFELRLGLGLETWYLYPSARSDVCVDDADEVRAQIDTRIQRLNLLSVEHELIPDEEFVPRVIAERIRTQVENREVCGAPLPVHQARDRCFAEAVLCHARHAPTVGVFGSNHLPGIAAHLCKEGYVLQRVDWLPIVPPWRVLSELL